ncbi:MAG: hypothetical protein JW723_00955 [Bacteroidales bacterium]|nr:hypothetical protein [Bacteroidales bacterium]
MEQQKPNQKTRPTMLTVVGILSFIGLGYRILTGLINAALGTATSSFAPFLEEVFENEADLSDVPESLQGFIEGIFDSVTKLLANVSGIYLTIVLLAIIALLGVILMWQLKKTGFYIYTASRSLIAFVPFIFIGYNMVSVIWFVSSIVFGILFIILYSLNLKEMS